MKRFKYIAMASVIALGSLGLASCGDFGDENIDPEHLNPTSVDYTMIFSNAQHQALGSDWDMWRTGCIYSAQFTQQLASASWWDSYGRYNYSDGYSASFWDTFNGDRGALRDVTTCYDKWQNAEGYEIDWNIARVMRCYAFAKMSDLYGDIPYSQAGRPDKYSYPVYDKQEDIYKSMLAELDEAQSKLTSGTAKMGSQDLYFNGDASKWKKFANSLMLRLAMRLVKVDPATAKTYAAKAYANGVITSNDDNVLLNHSGGVTTNDSSEPFAKINAHEDREFYLSKFFVGMLKDTKDPRLCLIGTVTPLRKDDKGIITSEQTTDVQAGWSASDYGDMSFAKQNGFLQGGYTNGANSQYFIGQADPEMDKTTANIIGQREGKDVYKVDALYAYFSSPNRYTYCDQTAPTFVITAAQTNLLLAEAAYRGYITGDAKSFYEAGVRCAFEQFAQFPAYANALSALNSDPTVGIAGGTLDAYATAYLANNPYDASKALEQINDQYYIATFGDPHEVFANWRRSGYPVLTPSVMAKKDGQCATAADGYSIPRRFIYPSKESQVNKTNYDEAVKRLTNGDTFYSRVWWDAK